MPPIWIPKRFTYLFCIIYYLRFPLFLTLPVIQFSLQKVAINQFIYLFITANGDVSGTLRDFTSSGGDSCRSGGVDSMDSHVSIWLNRSFKSRGIRSSTSKDACVRPSNISTGSEKFSPSWRSSKNLSEQESSFSLGLKL